MRRKRREFLLVRVISLCVPHQHRHHRKDFVYGWLQSTGEFQPNYRLNDRNFRVPGYHP